MVEAHDFPAMYDRLGVDLRKLGVIMLDYAPLPEYLMPNDDWGVVDRSRPYVDGWQPGRQPHVTLLHGLLQSGLSWKDHVDEVLDGWQPPAVSVVTDVVTFDTPESMEYCPVVLKLDKRTNDIMADAHARLSLLPHINSYPTYQPHLTVGFVDKMFRREVVAGLQDMVGLRLHSQNLNYGTPHWV